jgi:hypothetical protein
MPSSSRAAFKNAVASSSLKISKKSSACPIPEKGRGSLAITANQSKGCRNVVPEDYLLAPLPLPVCGRAIHEQRETKTLF